MSLTCDEARPRIFPAIVLISGGSTDAGETSFGTGFVVRRDPDYAYIVTCQHVVTNIQNGDEHRPVIVNGLTAEILPGGGDDGIDLCVLRVRPERPSAFAMSLPISTTARTGVSALVTGFHRLAGGNLVLDCRAMKLEDELFLAFLKDPNIRVPAWGLSALTDKGLFPGHSGSPVIDQNTGAVVAVANMRNKDADGKSGIAVSVEALRQIWTDAPSSTPTIASPAQTQAPLNAFKQSQVRALDRRLLALGDEYASLLNALDYAHGPVQDVQYRKQLLAIEKEASEIDAKIRAIGGSL